MGQTFAIVCWCPGCSQRVGKDPFVWNAWYHPHRGHIRRMPSVPWSKLDGWPKCVHSIKHECRHRTQSWGCTKYLVGQVQRSIHGTQFGEWKDRSDVVYLSICLSFCLSICLSVYLPICLSAYLSIYRSLYLSIDPKQSNSARLPQQKMERKKDRQIDRQTDR